VLDLEHHVGFALLANGESDLYLATIHKFDLAALNAISIAATGTAPSGLVQGFYVVFDLIVLAALFLYVRTLVRVVRGGTRGYPKSWYTVLALWREVVVPVVIVVRLPSATGEPWGYMLTGDLGFAAGLVVALGVTTLAARVWFFLRPPYAGSLHEAPEWASTPGGPDAVPAANALRQPPPEAMDQAVGEDATLLAPPP
jgi:hypothetical protein